MMEIQGSKISITDDSVFGDGMSQPNISRP